MASAHERARNQRIAGGDLPSENVDQPEAKLSRRDPVKEYQVRPLCDCICAVSQSSAVSRSIAVCTGAGLWPQL
jgi:hypothetical protein